MEELAINKKPIFECVSISKKGPNLITENDICLVPFGINMDTSITKSQLEQPFYSTRTNLNESITNPSRKGFLATKLSELVTVYNELKINNIDAAISAFYILNICAQNKQFNVLVSKTTEKEILLYTRQKNKFRNLLIDEDGDIHYILIGSKLGEEDSAFFPKEKKFDYKHLASLI